MGIGLEGLEKSEKINHLMTFWSSSWCGLLQHPPEPSSCTHQNPVKPKWITKSESHFERTENLINAYDEGISINNISLS